MRRGKLRLGVAGCGAVFERHHLPAIRKSRDWEFVAACDPLEARRSWVHSVMDGDLAVFESLSDLLAAVSVDGILIATPPDTHCALTVQALQAGLHVLVEKPMALNPVDAAAMLRASAHAQRHLRVGFCRRFLPAYIDLKMRIARIPTDRIRGVQFALSADSRRWKSVSTYLGDTTRGGDVWDDIVCHQLDLLPWLLGLEIQEISSEIVGISEWGQHVRCQLRFQGGLVAQCEARHTDRYLETVTVELSDRTLVADWRQGVGHNPMAESFTRQLTAFAAIARGHAPSIMGADAGSGLRNVQALFACRRGLESPGRWTPVAEVALST